MTIPSPDVLEALTLATLDKVISAKPGVRVELVCSVRLEYDGVVRRAVSRPFLIGTPLLG